jgi:hypothetical protein
VGNSDDVAEWLRGLGPERGGMPRWSAARRCRALAADGDVLRLIGPTALSPAIVYGGFAAGFDTPDLREAKTLLEGLT